MLGVEYLDVVGIGEKYLARLFEANAVFVEVAEVLFFIPLDLHGATLSIEGVYVNRALSGQVVDGVDARGVGGTVGSSPA